MVQGHISVLETADIIFVKCARIQRRFQHIFMCYDHVVLLCKVCFDRSAIYTADAVYYRGAN